MDGTFGTVEGRGGSVSTLAREKKQADQDATLLANRILMLDNEQTKMLKKIERTRKQAEKLLEVKQQNEERAKRLEEHREREDIAITAKQLRILQDRKQRQLLNQLVSQSNLERMKSSGQQTYLEKHMFVQLKHQIRTEAVAENQEAARKVRYEEQKQFLKQKQY